MLFALFEYCTPYFLVYFPFETSFTLDLKNTRIVNIFKFEEKGGNYLKEERSKRQETIQGNMVGRFIKIRNII